MKKLTFIVVIAVLGIAALAGYLRPKSQPCAPCGPAVGNGPGLREADKIHASGELEAYNYVLANHPSDKTIKARIAEQIKMIK